EEVTISGTAPETVRLSGAPQLSVSRNDIDAAGFASTQDILRTLPQVFGGGPTEDTVIDREARTNVAHGSGINLRGLGAGSTLVLMNGSRLPGGGTDGIFADFSSIPLSAIERLDILPDASSTLHGADAVSGVVNIVMRDRFKGQQTEAYIAGSTREGGI